MKLLRPVILLLTLGVLTDLRFASYGALPDSLALSEFVRIMPAFSEAAGHFPGDNFVTNETSYPHVIPTVIEQGKRGGVYIGVGTEQNFSYIAATRPEIAFIVDIRRENLLQHLLYKALFTLARDRTSFLMLLFGRQRREGGSASNGSPASIGPPDNKASIREVLDYVESSTAADSLLFELNWRRLRREVRRYGISGRDDLERMLYVYRSFYEEQLSIRYAETRLGNGLSYPTFKDLMTGTTTEGAFAGFLSTEETFGFVKDLHLRNLIIPVVGDFAGEKALRAIAAYAEAHDSTISVFYVSNVEYFLINHFFYVFEWYVANVDALPIDEHSLMIRSYLGVESHPKRVGRHLSTSTVHHISTFLERFRQGAYTRSRPVWWRFWPWDRPFWSGGGHSYYHLVITGDLCP